MDNEHKEMMESAEPTSKKVLAETQKQNELLEIQIRLLDRICTLKEEQQEGEFQFRNDWYESKIKQNKTSKKTLFFSAVAVVIGLVAIGVETNVKYGWCEPFLSYWGF